LTSAAKEGSGQRFSYHILGTDHLGRDVTTRLFYGGRISLLVSLSSVVLAAAAGLLIGLLAGNFGGAIDSVFMRIVDLQLAFPFILLALAIVALLGPSLQNIILVFTITSWPIYARTVRPMALSLREKEFVEAARAAGAGHGRVIFRHILPNIASPLIVVASFEVAKMVILEAAMGFLGLGVPPPTPTWGNMLADGRDYIRTAWWLTTFPGLAIMVTATGINLLGDALRDIFDPRLKYES
jgi:peptide/nickel transport system permease protein